MDDSGKSRRVTATGEDSSVVPEWLVSLGPLGVAFSCYVIFILAMGIEPRGEAIAYGAAAALVGVASYWILVGLRDNRLATMVSGFLGAAVAVLVLDMYLSYL